MPKPELTSPADFASPLHKRSGHTNQVTIYGDYISVGDPVNVNGTRGRKPTNWVGKIGAYNEEDDGFEVTDLHVDHEEESGESKYKEQDAGGGGAEDVSVTVTNAVGTSDPVTTPMVPTIP